MIIKTPSTYFLTAGSSEGFSELNAFDGALLAAGVGDTNLVKLSSICPPRAAEISPLILPYGALIPIAYGKITSGNAGEIISAAVALAVPEDSTFPGLIMEYSGVVSKEEAEAQVRQMAEEGMLMRDRKIKTIKSRAVSHIVANFGCAFAAIVLWN